MPTPIQANNMASSKGSFIGVLNLTIESAPTNPNDNVSDDLTINTTKNVDIVTKTNDFEKSNISLLSWLIKLYINLNIIESNDAINIQKMNSR